MVDKRLATTLHQQLVDTMRQSGVLAKPGVDAAFMAIPRHSFLPDLPLEQVYQDRAITLKYDGNGMATSSSSQPTMMALMLHQADLQPGDNVLEIGTATGYNAALMKHIVGESGRVTSIELDADLVRLAEENLIRARMRGVNIVQGDGARGYAPRAQYDHIIATVGVWDIPSLWFDQLKPNGSIIAPIVIDGIQASARFERQVDGTFLSRENRPCSFVYMRGINAGPNIRKQVSSTAMYIIADKVDNLDTAALHLLLSDDHELCYLESPLTNVEYWHGFQIFLMLQELPEFVFALYTIFDGQTAYGLEGRGIALITRGSASLANYSEKGMVHCFAGADAFLAMQKTLDSWNTRKRPTVKDLRLRLIPKTMAYPRVSRGKVYDRRDHYLHAWMDG